jgi:hypothetical protein
MNSLLATELGCFECTAPSREFTVRLSTRTPQQRTAVLVSDHECLGVAAVLRGSLACCALVGAYAYVHG